MTTQDAPTKTVRITVTETSTTTYTVSAEELEAMGLPTGAEELSQHDADDLAATLEDASIADVEMAVTERDVDVEEVGTTPPGQ